jgi:hypothetical protein
LWAAPLGRALQITNGDQVALPDGANVPVAEADECLGLAGRKNELDLQTIGVMQVYDRAQITTAEAMLGEVPIQDDGVE